MQFHTLVCTTTVCTFRKHIETLKRSICVIIQLILMQPHLAADIYRARVQILEILMILFTRNIKYRIAKVRSQNEI